MYMFYGKQESETVTRDLSGLKKEDEPSVLCSRCRHVITGKKLQIPVDGAWSRAFANPHGIVYEIVFFKQAKGAVVTSLPCDEFSWFPGYAWAVSGCGNCGIHIGWLFTSENDAFFGLILDQLIIP